MKERFWNKVEFIPFHDCWEWIAGKNDAGYGRFKVEGKNRYAHRVSWFLKYGRFPKDCSLHRCDNRTCVNPDHLFEGSREDNVDDMWKKNRFKSSLREKNGRAKLTEFLVTKIRIEYQKGGIFQWQLGEKYGVSQPVISKIIRNERWIF